MTRKAFKGEPHVKHTKQDGKVWYYLIRFPLLVASLFLVIHVYPLLIESRTRKTQEVTL